MSSLKSKTTPHSTKNPSLRWTDLEIQHIVAWLGYRDEFGELSNFDLYQTGNKTTAAKKLLYDTGIAETKSGVTKEKTRDKLGTMIKLYKDWRDKAETTGWGVDPANHHHIANKSIGLQTIQEVLVLKCPWYYEFEVFFFFFFSSLTSICNPLGYDRPKASVHTCSSLAYSPFFVRFRFFSPPYLLYLRLLGLPLLSLVKQFFTCSIISSLPF